jgi:hypothetical protein
VRQLAAKYEKGLFNQLQDVMQKHEKLSLEFKQFKTDHKWEIAVMRETHSQEIAELKGTHQQIYEVQKQEISRLETKIVSLEAENALLKTRLDKDSSNSSKPPSGDGFKKPQNSREKTGRRPGG